MQTGSEEDPRALKKRISELEAENRALKELLALLQSLPAVAEQRDSALASKKKKKETRDKKRAAVQRRREGGGGSDAASTGEAAPG